MDRRTLLRAGGIGGLFGLAGCSDLPAGLVGGSDDGRMLESPADLSGSTGDGWTEYGYDDRTSNAALDAVVPDGWPQRIWQTTTENAAIGRREPFTPMPLADAVLVETAGPDGEGVAALDPSTGERQWHHRLSGVRNGSVVGNAVFLAGDSAVTAISRDDGEPHWTVENVDHEPGGRPTVADGVAFVSHREHTLVARDPETGETLWTYGDRRTQSTPAVHDGTVYVETDAAVHAVPTDPEFEGDAEDEERSDPPTAVPSWTRELNDVPESYHHRHSVVVDAEAGLVLVVESGDGSNGRLRALSTASGEPVWKHEVTAGPITGRPAAANGTAFVGVDAGLVAVEYGGGDPKQRWKRTGATPVGDAPTVAGDTVYASFRHGEVRAFDRESGERRWRTTLLATTTTSPIVHDGRLYVGTERGTVAFERRGDLAAADTGLWPTRKGTVGRTGTRETDLGVTDAPKLDWVLSYGSRGGRSPVLADGIAVFGGNEVTAVDAASGDPVWQARPESRGTPLGVATDGERVYVCADWADIDGGNRTVVEAYDLHTGDREWAHETEGRPVGGPGIVDETVYIGVEGGPILGLDATSGTVDTRLDQPGTVWRIAVEDDWLVTGVIGAEMVACWHLPTEQLAWRQPVTEGEADRGVVVDAGTAYVSQAAGMVHAFDVESGEEIWTYDPDGDRSVWNLVAGDDRLFGAISGGTDAGEVLALNRSTGELAWNTPPSGRGLVRVGDAIVMTRDGVLTAIETTDGSTRWTLPAEAIEDERIQPESLSPATGIAVGDDGLYVATDRLSFKYTQP